MCLKIYISILCFKSMASIIQNFKSSAVPLSYATQLFIIALLYYNCVVICYKIHYLSEIKSEMSSVFFFDLVETGIINTRRSYKVDSNFGIVGASQHNPMPVPSPGKWRGKTENPV